MKTVDLEKTLTRHLPQAGQIFFWKNLLTFVQLLAGILSCGESVGDLILLTLLTRNYILMEFAVDKHISIPDMLALFQ